MSTHYLRKDEVSIIQEIMNGLGYDMKVSFRASYQYKRKSNEKKYDLIGVLESAKDNLPVLKNIPVGSVKTVDGYIKKIAIYADSIDKIDTPFYLEDGLEKKAYSYPILNLNKKQKVDLFNYIVDNYKTMPPEEFELLKFFPTIDTQDLGYESVLEMFNDAKMSERLKNAGISKLLLCTVLESGAYIETYTKKMLVKNFTLSSLKCSTKFLNLDKNFDDQRVDDEIDKSIIEFVDALYINCNNGNFDKTSWLLYYMKNIEFLLHSLGDDVFKISRNSDEFYGKIMSLKDWGLFNDKSLEKFEKLKIEDKQEVINFFIEPNEHKYVEYIAIDFNNLKKVIPSALHDFFKFYNYEKKTCDFANLLESTMLNALSLSSVSASMNNKEDTLILKIDAGCPIDIKECKKIVEILIKEVCNCLSVAEIKNKQNHIIINVFNEYLNKDVLEQKDTKTNKNELVRKF